MTGRRVAPSFPHYGPMPVALDGHGAALRMSYLRWRTANACPACRAWRETPCRARCPLSTDWRNRHALVLALSDVLQDMSSELEGDER